MSDHSINDAPPLDVLIVPGGAGTRLQQSNRVLLDYISRQGAHCDWVASVCTGVRLLLAAGLAVGETVTTYWSVIPELRAQGKAAAVLDDVRFMRDGNIVTTPIFPCVFGPSIIAALNKRV